MWILNKGPSSKAEAAEIRKRISGHSKFLVDESLGPEVANIINSLGWNAVFAADMGLNGRSDEDIFAFACKEKRILLTHDHHFLDDRRFPYYRNTGVVVMPGGDGKGESLARAITNVIKLLGNYRNLFPNAKIEISKDGTWNIKELKKKQGRLTKRRLRLVKNGSVWEWKAMA
jgi:predicted nuclease of predicted toxin-antitoxin system